MAPKFVIGANLGSYRGQGGGPDSLYPVFAAVRCARVMDGDFLGMEMTKSQRVL